MTPDQFVRVQAPGVNDVLLGSQDTGLRDATGNIVYRTAAFQASFLSGIVGVANPFVVDGLTATGNDQDSALELEALVNIFNIVPGGTGVRLRPGVVNARIMILNRGVNSLLVYPPKGSQIELAGANVPGTIVANASAQFLCASGLNWYVA